MKIGIEMHHGYNDENLPVDKALEKAKRDGYDGVYYKNPMAVSETLDLGEMKAAKQCADELGLYIDFGIGRVNPFNTNETPEVWQLGGGDYKLAVEKMIHAAASIGAKELIGVTAGWKGKHIGYHVYDRFRTDVTWEEQLQATTRFIQKIAPTLRDTGTRINLETHEEITSYEIIRMIEEIGDDVLGVALDTANVVSRAEEPVAVAKRAAPYIHQMHAKDCILFFSDNGLVRQVKPSGEGIVNYKEIFQAIAPYDPDLHIQIEDHKGFMHVDIYVEVWRQAHPDLSIVEVTELVRLARQTELQVLAGEMMDPKAYEAIHYNLQKEERLSSSQKHLRAVLTELKL
ncbi:sugar phosphate isomerase/epimerase family protein [Paenibacillus planticolens]|uniref:TIM barrel protein n=1 Tax=Paenibacillus planticolens TaxID=2654976 RepID=A0ABX1ZEZ9_9BACL|nr:sugar phosphate isomerase/epimerase [Paenibacillus planticolens]NOU98661.1 TIM barrel protein [Paenibacillus planticolens]